MSLENGIYYWINPNTSNFTYSTPKGEFRILFDNVYKMIDIKVPYEDWISIDYGNKERTTEIMQNIFIDYKEELYKLVNFVINKSGDGNGKDKLKAIKAFLE
jgi:hypothetical protein